MHINFNNIIAYSTAVHVEFLREERYIIIDNELCLLSEIILYVLKIVYYSGNKH